MLLNLRKKEDCAFDMIALGEIMLRLDPGDTRIKTTRSFRAWEGGGESYNATTADRTYFVSPICGGLIAFTLGW